MQDASSVWVWCPPLLTVGVLLCVFYLQCCTRKKFVFEVESTTAEMQAELAKEAREQCTNDNVQVSSLSSISLAMCVPFRGRQDRILTEEGKVSVSEVGGKGLSLLKMSQVPGIKVPMGFVLPVSFFEEWTNNVRESAEFREFLEAASQASHSTSTSSVVKTACQKLKAICLSQKFSVQMRAAVLAGLEHIYDNEEGKSFLVAVRSSSPEEDLVGFSFAGGYETVLGVRAEVECLQNATAQVFASCYDERVFVYKVAQGFHEAAKNPQIAVVIQQQVDARAAGVAFSLHPVCNDQDVALITACYGLGESCLG